MDRKEAKIRIEKLKKVISYHRFLYHVKDKQEISDAALDSLKRELYNLEREFPDLITKDSPTQRVAGQLLDGFKKRRHRFPMLSIQDIFSEEDLDDWQNYLKRLTKESIKEYFCEFKIDGFSTSLIYENGLFSHGVTRGNGREGEDVTQNLKTIGSIPLKLEINGNFPNKEIEDRVKRLISNGIIEVRGEAYMGKKEFNRINKKLEKNGEKTYSNPRNLAAGTIRQLDPKIASSRKLEFLAFNIVTDLAQENHSREHKILPVLGFKTHKGKICHGPKEIMDFWKKANSKKLSFDFQIDGIVINVNNNSIFDSLGVAGKSPRGMRALKFTPEQATTKVLDIQVQVGRTGSITPVAIFSPVKIGGVNVERATLHNEDEIGRLGLKIGDTVIVGRAGDVIPKVLKVLSSLRTGKEKTFKMPSKCPACNTGLRKTESDIIIKCSNVNCPARQKKNYSHFVSKSAFNIVGLGPQIIDRLIGGGLISSPADLFLLKEEEIFHLERFAEKSIGNLINSIQSSKSISLPRFIFALGIDNVGEQTAQVLADTFKSINALKNAKMDELEAIKDIGPRVSKSIRDYFRNNKKIKFLEKLKKVGIKIEEQGLTNQKLKESSFVLTGSLDSLTRLEARKKIQRAGGRVFPSVSRSINFLIAGKNPGSKLQKAKKFGIKILNEKAFIRMLK